MTGAASGRSEECGDDSDTGYRRLDVYSQNLGYRGPA